MLSALTTMRENKQQKVVILIIMILMYVLFPELYIYYLKLKNTDIISILQKRHGGSVN